MAHTPDQIADLLVHPGTPWHDLTLAILSRRVEIRVPEDLARGDIVGNVKMADGLEAAEGP